MGCCILICSPSDIGAQSTGPTSFFPQHLRVRLSENTVRIGFLWLVAPVQAHGETGMEIDLVVDEDYVLDCVSASTMPEYYDDCPTAGVFDGDQVNYGTGTYDVGEVEVGIEYLGEWTFSGATAYNDIPVSMSISENEDRCPGFPDSPWCRYELDGRNPEPFIDLPWQPNTTEVLERSWHWTSQTGGFSRYFSYSANAGPQDWALKALTGTAEGKLFVFDEGEGVWYLLRDTGPISDATVIGASQESPAARYLWLFESVSSSATANFEFTWPGFEPPPAATCGGECPASPSVIAAVAGNSSSAVELEVVVNSGLLPTMAEATWLDNGEVVGERQLSPIHSVGPSQEHLVIDGLVCSREYEVRVAVENALGQDAGSTLVSTGACGGLI